MVLYIDNLRPTAAVVSEFQPACRKPPYASTSRRTIVSIKAPSTFRLPKRVYVAGVGVGLIALTLAGCSAPTGESSGSSAGSEISLGVLAPLTGTSAADGLLMVEGAKLAATEINKAGGVNGHKVKVVAQDTKDQSAAAVTTAVSALTSDPNVVGVFTAYASTTNFEINLLAKAHMPYIIGGNTAQTAGIVSPNPSKFPTIWSVAPTYAGYNTDFPARLKEWDADGTFPLRNKKAFIISSDNPFSNGIADGMKSTLVKDGWTVTGPDTQPFGSIDDWTTEISKIHAVDPSVVINLDYQTANAASFMTQFSQNPTKSMVFLQYAPTVPQFEELAGDAANGVISNLPFSPLPKTPAGKHAIDAFGAAYKTSPGLNGVTTYVEVKLWEAAAKKVGDPTKTLKVGKEIGKLKMTTAFGLVHFDQKTHLAVAGGGGLSMTYYQVQDKKEVLIYPKSAAEGKFETPSWIK